MAEIRATLIAEYDDLLQPVPPRLPPLRAVNHKIPLIDEKKRYTYRLPKCAEALKGKLLEKIERYTAAGWWTPAQVEQAAPLMCIYKKDGGLRTVVDLRLRNDNTVKDVTPFPDQDQIRHDVARAKYRSKLDMSDAYEQTRIIDEDVWKTAFATVYGTFLSHVTQQGDCNAPSTFQRLMVHIFREKIGISVHVYLDDIFIFSMTIEQHEKDIRWCLEQLREHGLHLSRKKFDLYSQRMDCLGHLVDNRGLHADSDKMSRVRNWPTPKNYNEVQQFLGLVQYLAHFMPDVSAYTGPLSSMTRNGQQFVWRPLHQKCLDSIKVLACKTPILRPIDPSNPEPIWVITDASTSGVGAVYGQGPDWHNCRPAGFMSKKFTSAQHSYFTFEMEALGVLEALLKWEDKLIGRRFRIVTDHKALTFLKDKRKLPQRLERWMEYLSRFDYEVIYVKGESNKVADSLSRYYASEEANSPHPPYDLVSADARLDPDHETLSGPRVAELRARRVMDVVEPRRVETLQMNQSSNTHAEELPTHQDTDDPTIGESRQSVPDLERTMAGEFDLLRELKRGYEDDALCRKVVANPTHHERFRLQDGIVEHMNNRKQWVRVIPNAKYGRKRLTQVIIDHAHTLLGHLGTQRTTDYIRRWFWWPQLAKEVDKFCVSCGTCQTTKSATQKPQGLLHNLPVPTRPWQSISMDFVGPFPESGGYDYLWVIVCRMTAMTHLIPTKTTVRASELAWMFVREIIRLHGMPESIVSDRDPKFTAKFWRELHRLLGIKLLTSTAFHPQTDGMSERTIRTISQILRAMVEPEQRNWAQKVPLVEFALNSSQSATTGYSPFELNHGYLPTMMRGLAHEPALPGVRDFAERALQYIHEAHDAIIASRVSQTHHANRSRRAENGDGDPDFAVDKLAYLSTANLSLPKGRARKLMPKYIGPYRITSANTAASTYTLDLPPDLRARGIFPTFHVSRLRRHEPNDEQLFPSREAGVFYDFGTDPEQEFLVDDIVAHEWRGNTVHYLVQWDDGDTTWEPWATVKDLEAIDRYFELQGVTSWRELPRNGAKKSSIAKQRAVNNGQRKQHPDRPEDALPATRAVHAHVTASSPDSAEPGQQAPTGRGHRVRRPTWKLRADQDDSVAA